ncbi:metal-dependent hydrolase [Halegenticoccus tardaugens]|uniref:metal-dependent hydrolase n=1 Tax=Halegenticoccus tardaugens TaxID=2071624 RepID=UPI00100BA35A|nr:metal-dependent hydrolase [Halegenticoccus tardaugens]
MYAPGHVGIALLCYSPVAALLTHNGRHRERRAGTVGVLVCAALPDADLYIIQLMHRGITHTLWMALAVALVFGITGWATGRHGSRAASSARFGFAVGALGVGSHLAGDVITPLGLRPLYPLSDATYSLALVYSRTPAVNVAFFALGVGAFAASHALARAGRLTVLPGVTDAPRGNAPVLGEGDAGP